MRCDRVNNRRVTACDRSGRVGGERREDAAGFVGQRMRTGRGGAVVRAGAPELSARAQAVVVVADKRSIARVKERREYGGPGACLWIASFAGKRPRFRIPDRKPQPPDSS